MKLTSRRLRQIIMEELRRSRVQNGYVMSEGTSRNPVRITPAYLNRLIKEELELSRRQKRLAESRKKRLRARRILEAKRRRLNSLKAKRNNTVYYY